VKKLVINMIAAAVMLDANSIVASTIASAIGKKNSPRDHRASTKSRTHRRCGPLSRVGRYRSSPVRSAWYSRSRLARARSRSLCPATLRSAGTSGRRFAASDCFRLGVGRPLPACSASVGSGVTTSGTGCFLRRGTGQE